MSTKSVEKKREWSDQEVYELINLYEQEACLWDVKHVNYRNRDKKMRCYEEIARKFVNCDGGEVQRKMHNLRNQVSHELQKMKKVKSGDGAEDRYASRWKFFNALQFIVPCFTPTQSTSNMNNSLDNLEITQDEQEQTMATPSKKKISNKKRIQAQNDDDILKEALEVIKKPKDDLDRFGDYVALELKTIKSDYYRGLLKREIRKAISHFSDLDEVSYWSSVMPASASTDTSTSSSPMPSPGVSQQQQQSVLPLCEERTTYTYNSYTDL